MNPEVNNTDVENPKDGIDLSTDDLAAAMGFITTMGDQQMQAQQAQEGAMGAEIAPGEEQMQEAPQEPQIDPEALKEEIKVEMLGDLKKELKKIIRAELEGLIEEEDDAEENDSTKDAE